MSLIDAIPVTLTKVRELLDADLPGLQEKAKQTGNNTSRRMRDSHHALARALASGMKIAEASAVTGFSVPYIHLLDDDPAFNELLSHYRAEVNAEHANLRQRLATLALDVSQVVQDRIHENPEGFSNKDLQGLLTSLADRTGVGPSSTVHAQVDVITGMDYSQLRAAEQALQKMIEGKVIGASISPLGEVTPIEGDSLIDLNGLTAEQLYAMKTRVSDALSRKRLYSLFPDEGPLRRELYPKHIAFFEAGAKHQERAFIAANRLGKTTAAAYEVTCHATGWYPDWWPGRRFTRPIVTWACGEDAKSMRESIQPILLGFPLTPMGTGMIPADAIVGDPTKRAGVPEGIDSFIVRHSSGGTSRIVLKTFDMGRESYQGAKVDVVWLDEEPPLPIYTEALTRTMSTVPGEPNGSVLCTFTPLKGLSAVVMLYMPGGRLA